MPEPISLISSADVKPEEFENFLQQVGAVLHPDNLYDGRLSKGNINVWIALDNSELTNFDVEEIELITQRLGGSPKTHILLDVSKKPGSEKIALEFACNFATKWNCVIYDSNQKVYSTQELLKLCQTA
ncbi:hypothetical protein [Iningainema tapete]|uniref:Uncharacterized protein n=1 Tax=Iningainema tapete BLCC-T55 TaxID=2748662 RepID=A0A8J6XP74_9CYAN|nr:hypothetical protein [Iningainema tapete]MBD2774741.1 hypothetical protein [Iningainema tapete BLCC-T55]